MKIEHVRIANVSKPKEGRYYCISHVYVDGEYSHDTIEDIDRGLDESMSSSKVASIKVKTKTAIPTGHYVVKMDRKSPKFSQKAYYMKVCGGKVPCLDPVVGFGGILIHCGVNENSSAGCVIVGLNKKVGKVEESQATFEKLYARMLAAHKRGEKIEYVITRKYSV